MNGSTWTMTTHLLARLRLPNWLHRVISFTGIIAVAIVLMSAKTHPGLDVELISIGLDGQAGGGGGKNR